MLSKTLSRGQRKRLKGKEKFLNAKILEARTKITNMIHKDKLKVLQKTQ